jgi:hypothetical protein
MNATAIPEQTVKVEQTQTPMEKQMALKESQLITTENVNPFKIVPVETSSGRYIFSVFHSIMSLVAIYLSFRCNNGFEIGPFFVACCCPYIYIIYILATRGTCGIIEGENKNFN